MLRARFSPSASKDPFADFEQVFKQRIEEADIFYSFLQVDFLLICFYSCFNFIYLSASSA